MSKMNGNPTVSSISKLESKEVSDFFNSGLEAEGRLGAKAENCDADSSNHSLCNSDTNPTIDSSSSDQCDESHVLTDTWVIAEKEKGLANILIDNDILRQENSEVKMQLQKQNMEIDILLKRNAQLEEDSMEVPNLDKLRSTLNRLKRVFGKVGNRMGKDVCSRTQIQLNPSKQWIRENWETFKMEVDGLAQKKCEKLSFCEQTNCKLEGKLDNAEKALEQLNIGVLSSVNLQPAKKATVENRLSQSIIAVGQAFQKMRAPPLPPALLAAALCEDSRAPQSVAKLTSKQVSSEVFNWTPVTAVLSSIPTSVITHSSLQPRKSCVAPVTPVKTKGQRSVAKQATSSLIQYSTWPLTHLGNRKAMSMSMKPGSTSKKAGSPAEDTPAIRQNICGLCGGSFSSLNQLKLHHTVIHSNSIRVGRTVHIPSASSHYNLKSTYGIIPGIPPRSIVHQDRRT